MLPHLNHLPNSKLSTVRAGKDGAFDEYKSVRTHWIALHGTIKMDPQLDNTM